MHPAFHSLGSATPLKMSADDEVQINFCAAPGALARWCGPPGRCDMEWSGQPMECPRGLLIVEQIGRSHLTLGPLGPDQGKLSHSGAKGAGYLLRR